MMIIWALHLYEIIIVLVNFYICCIICTPNYSDMIIHFICLITSEFFFAFSTLRVYIYYIKMMMMMIVFYFNVKICLVCVRNFSLSDSSL